MKLTPPLHAVILAGGFGERFWPASRSAVPKPFLRVIGDQTLLDATIERARRIAADDRIWIVCGEEHARLVRRASGLPPSRILAEPRRRNTAMAAAWAAHRIARVDEDAVLAVLPADHHVPDIGAFARDIRLAARAAHRERALVTLGIEPTRPETGYGYIESGERVEAFERICRVRRFVEKPDLATAKRYVASGAYRWNAGIFVWSAATLLEEIEHLCPELHRALAPFRAGAKRKRGRGDRARGARTRQTESRREVEAAFRRAPSLPIDVAVMERSDRVLTLPAGFWWSDVGTWASLADELRVGMPGKASSGPGRKATGGPGRRATRGPNRRATGAGRRRAAGDGDVDGNRVLGGEALFEASRGNLVWTGKRLVALLGVEDLVVVDTEDVTLVTNREASSDVKRLVERLRKLGRTEFT